MAAEEERASSSRSGEKPAVEYTPDGMHDDRSSDHENTFDVDATELPPGYFTSPFFLGTMTGIGLGLMAGVAGFGFAAPILMLINNDIGPDKNIAWVALTYTLTSAVALTIIGRVTDIFGRRWVFVGGAFLGIVGCIVAATAQSVGALIGGTTIIGIAAATQLSYYYVMGELVPMKYRLHGNAFCYAFTIPGSGLSPAIARAFIQNHPNVSWRGCYYVLIGVNTLSFLCWFFFYHPPTFRMKHGENASVMKYIKNFDYVGTTLYTGGLMIVMMGLNWGGTVYAWKSAYVIGTIVAGFVGLVLFVLWESFAKLKEPLVPMGLFKNHGWNAATILSGLGASVYYALAIVWPNMIGTMYTDMDPMTSAWYASFVGLFIIIGEIVGGVLGKSIGHLKWQCVVTVLISGIFFGCTATSTPDSFKRTATFVALGTFAIGWAESLAITIVTISVWDQTKLGSASGVAGSIRFFIASIASTIYNVVLNNRLAKTIPARVPSALVEAGLPSSSVADFMTGLTTGAGFADVKGITDSIIATGVRAFKEANAEAYRTVFFVSIAMSGLALISALLLPNVDDMLTGKVASTLHKSLKDEKPLKEENAV
ncbi:putative HC-toxin efflux carrier-like protein [Hapsidospora chrysogenum ATCC 11550]|uniref:Putative HC-toxin efflux carrier-like protein n=1 Tax=Hapsidospora chrysogenum (strain ATCC 11550 / CBS 779.69 / DSM 880 / IAM 14645 / JCM 23072 / IMI 49137) TaxID=857340 RepID=A0A086TGZ4_HAPC1|nr:putative HC-toxin efflux carrier-like protein [Hapsidospora chrysogenum ATCC 11550]